MELEEEQPARKMSKKRKYKDISGGCGSSDDEEETEATTLVETFKHEALLKDKYEEVDGKRAIYLKEPFFIALDTKKLMRALDLKKEVILTMLNQMEKGSNAFFKLHSNLHVGLQLRFFSRTLEELAGASSANAKFYQAFQELAVSRQGVFRCNMMDLASTLGLKPYKLTRVLYQL